MSRVRAASPLDPRDAEVTDEECGKWFWKQIMPGAFYAGPKGAVICESAEAATDYTTLADDPAMRQKTLLSGLSAPCMMVPPDKRYEMIPEQRNQFGGVIRVRKLGKSDQVFAIITEWQKYPGALSAKLDAVCGARAKAHQQGPRLR